MPDLKTVVSRIQRELPDTDQTRYDVAYERGRAQARSTLMFGGLAVGSALGAGLMWLMDPAHGASRRAQLSSRIDELRQTVQERMNRDDAAAPTESTGMSGEFGRGYDVGFGQTVNDPTAPGSQVPDPIRSEEVVTYGESGPVGGATMTTADEVESARR